MEIDPKKHQNLKHYFLKYAKNRREVFEIIGLSVLMLLVIFLFFVLYVATGGINE